MGNHEFFVKFYNNKDEKIYTSLDDITYGLGRYDKINVFQKGGEFYEYYETLKIAVKVNDNIYVHGALTSDNLKGIWKHGQSAEKTLKKLNDFWTGIRNYSWDYFRNNPHILNQIFKHAPFLNNLTDESDEVINESFKKESIKRNTQDKCQKANFALLDLNAVRMFVAQGSYKYQGHIKQLCGNKYEIKNFDIMISDGEFLNNEGKIIDENIEHEIAIIQVITNQIEEIKLKKKIREVQDVHGVATFVDVI
eukprot:GHVR01166072.1.p1 GENE.GHVR01166072.1~~GHVR01166072.1.p1  ORF type:complete len:251 (+),score=33.40 GHVR01166072.1:395-1147(+)